MNPSVILQIITKVNPADENLCTVNSNFANTANNEFFNTANKEFLDEIKSPSKFDIHEFNTNVRDTDFIVNCSTKNTDRAISNTDNSSEEVLSKSSLENVIQELKTLITNVKDFQNKDWENFDTNNIRVPEHTLGNKLPNWFTSISNSEVWKKRTLLIVRDSIVSGLRESEISFRSPLFSWSKNTRYVLLPGTVAT